MQHFPLKLILTLLGTCLMAILFAQEDYNAYYMEMSPVEDSLSEDEKMEALYHFLSEARQSKDSHRIILGNLYLANAEFMKSNFTDCMEYLIEAETFAEKVEDMLLQGRASHKKGALYTTLKNYPAAIEAFELALAKSEEVQDSQNIAITLEQLGAVYGYIDDFAKANAYYREAIPLVKKHCGKRELAVTLSNYGNILSYQDSISRAIDVYRQAVAVSEEIEDEYRMVSSKQNLALEYYYNDELDRSLELYRECLQINERNGWLDFLIYTYDGLSLVFEEKRDLDSALYYFKSFHYLKDSVIGSDVQNQIGQLESENKSQQQELEILKQKELAERNKQRLKITLIGSAFLLILSGIGIWSLRAQKNRTRIQLEEKRKDLNRLAQFLQVKNAELRDLKATLLKNEKILQDQEKEEIIDPYNIKIITPDDWQAFKSLFEKSYPAYLQEVRKSYSEISEAEERLFLLLKLKLSSREMADILGVQLETVKKTRTRLRKRLQLCKGASLEKFIENFA